MYKVPFRILHLFFVAALLVSPASPIIAQENSSTFGWDLTYSSILKINQIGPKEWVRDWLKTYTRSPAKTWISEWHQEPIVSSVLIEFPVFAHAGERSTLWLFRTKSHAYFWESVQSDVDSVERIAERTQKTELKPDVYDNFFMQVISCEQAKPLKPLNAPPDGIPGFLGFFSLYDKRTSRQILLNLEDFVVCETKKCEKIKPGRVMAALPL